MKKVITFGEVMMRLSPENHQRFQQATSLEVTFGGAESNVVASLAKWGVPTAFVSRFPENEWGDSAVQEIRKLGVDTSGVIYGGDRLGLYFLEKGAGIRSSKIIYDRTRSSFSEIEPGMIDWETVLKDADWFHWTGITVGVSKSAADTCLEAVKTAKKLGLTVSGDPNYRSNLFDYCDRPNIELERFVSLTDLLIASEYDALQLFGLDLEAPKKGDEIDLNQFTEFCSILTKKYPNLSQVASSKRKAFSASHNQLTGLLYENNHVFSTKTFDLTPIVDRVGSGDTFMSGLIYGSLFFGEDRQKIIDFANAAACLKHSIPGDVNLASLSEIKNFMEGDTSGRIKR